MLALRWFRQLQLQFMTDNAFTRGEVPPLETLRDYVQRSTHWQEGGADRHAAIEALGELADDIEWTDKGLAEWRDRAMSNDRQAKAARASARVAIGHLQAILNESRTFAESQTAETAARDWLESIGSEPSGRMPTKSVG